MQSNKGVVGAVILFVVAVLAGGGFLYLKKHNFDEREMKFFSIFDKKLTLDFSNKAPVVQADLPKVEAGPDVLIKYPKTSVELKGEAIATDGGPLTYAWYKLSGGIANISSPFSNTTSVGGLRRGKYLFRLIATDSKGVRSSDEVTITMEGGPAPVVVKAKKKSPPRVAVNQPASQGQIQNQIQNQPTYTEPSYVPPNNSGSTQNVPPVANAGPDHNITLPESSVVLYGSGNDTDGSITSYSWVQVEGGAANVDSPSQSTTNISGLSAGTYRFQLSVTDDSGATDTDTVVVSVTSGAIQINLSPSVDAGSDQFVVLPDSSATLSGSATDPDGTIVSYQWIKIEGDGGNITSPTSATTTVTGLSEGSYVFQITATDDRGASDSSSVAVNVNIAN